MLSSFELLLVFVGPEGLFSCEAEAFRVRCACVCVCAGVCVCVSVCVCVCVTKAVVCDKSAKKMLVHRLAVGSISRTLLRSSPRPRCRSSVFIRPGSIFAKVNPNTVRDKWRELSGGDKVKGKFTQAEDESTRVPGPAGPRTIEIR